MNGIDLERVTWYRPSLEAEDDHAEGVREITITYQDSYLTIDDVIAELQLLRWTTNRTDIDGEELLELVFESGRAGLLAN